MISKETKERIERAAQKVSVKVWQKFPIAAPTTVLDPLLTEIRAALEAEADRAAGLVKALEHVVRKCYATGPHAEHRDRVISDILQGAEKALSEYKNPA